MDDPLLNKMQMLMGKYQLSSITSGDIEIQGPNLPEDKKSGFPVLTDIVKLGDAVFHAHTPDHQNAEYDATPGTQTNDTASQIAQQILTVIDAQLKNQIDTLITPRLQRAMDETLAVLLPQLVINIEAVIHETLVKECSRHGIPLKDGEDSA
ncbi:MAG: hypothetical protein ACYCSS_08065 [Sulfuriferula sp.]